MSVYLGLDVGSVSLKLALLGDEADRQMLRELARRSNGLFFDPEDEVSQWAGKGPRGSRTQEGGVPVILSRYERVKGRPVEAVARSLRTILSLLPPGSLAGMRLTGSGGRLVSDLLGVASENEFKAVARAFGAVCPDVETVFGSILEEIGELQNG